MRALALLLLLVGCAEQYHVRLPAPSPMITPDARVAMYWQMRPIKEATVRVNGGVTNETILLGDQSEVVSPEDLEPLVPANSETMRYARASVRAREKRDWLFKISVPLVIGGACTYGFTDGTPSLIGAGVAILGALIPYTLSWHYDSEELALRRRAFDAYPADLGRRLNVCAHGSEVIPCEAPLPTPPLPTEPLPPATSVPDRTGSLRMRDNLFGY